MARIMELEERFVAELEACCGKDVFHFVSYGTYRGDKLIAGRSITVYIPGKRDERIVSRKEAVEVRRLVDKYYFKVARGGSPRSCVYQTLPCRTLTFYS